MHPRRHSFSLQFDAEKEWKKNNQHSDRAFSFSYNRYFAAFYASFDHFAFIRWTYSFSLLDQNSFSNPEMLGFYPTGHVGKANTLCTLYSHIYDTLNVKISIVLIFSYHNNISRPPVDWALIDHHKQSWYSRHIQAKSYSGQVRCSSHLKYNIAPDLLSSRIY